ncbi:MAG: aromatic ring-hydroxylating dioxygenase subunit alpha [Gammaproteobacteria bacterium]
MYPFTEGSFAVRNAWYVTAFAHEAKRELLSRWILNEPVVIYRKEDGRAVALAGRCPHRHFPLGKSCLKGDAIQCGYHGITFGADGKCTHIPSQKAIPGTYRLRQYPLIEHGMWLWIWPGDPELADEALLPDLKAMGYENPEFRFRPFYSVEIAGRYQLMNDNLSDLTHLAYLHGSSIGVEANASQPEERSEDGERVLRSRRVMRGAPQADFAKGRFNYEGPVDRISGMDFYPPGFHAGVDDSAIPMDHPTRAGEILNVGRVFHAVTPGLKNTCNYFFSMGGKMTEADLDFFEDYLKSVVDEDIFATVEIEKMLTSIGYEPKELMLKSDMSAVRGRRVLQAMMDRETKNAAAPKEAAG